MKTILNQLFEYGSLERDQAREVLVNIAAERYNPSQVAAFMSVYLMRAIKVEELSGFRDAMLEMCLQVEFDDKETIDIVGTGGDGKDTFNVSTLASFVIAGAGIKVTKHGNYGVSSISGSSNVLESLGCRFSNNRDVLQRQLDEAGICFLHAPLFHPAMKSIAPIRKELGVRTFFNMLGPLINPCHPKYQLLGVYNLEMARLYNYLLQGTTTKYCIVHSLDGYDEISLTSDFKMISSQAEKIMKPADLGFEPLSGQDLYGGATIEKAAEIFKDILEGRGTKQQQNAVIANAALAMRTVKPETSFTDCVLMAKESLESKNAHTAFKKLIQ